MHFGCHRKSTLRSRPGWTAGSISAVTLLERARILWIDDRPWNNEAERSVLERRGVKVLLARSSEEAMGVVALEGVDLVISHIDAATAENPETETGIRLWASQRAVPVIHYVTDADPAQAVPAGSFGLTDQPGELIALILEALERDDV